MKNKKIFIIILFLCLLPNIILITINYLLYYMVNYFNELDFDIKTYNENNFISTILNLFDKNLFILINILVFFILIMQFIYFFKIFRCQIENGVREQN